MITLGVKYRDKITGFEGIATGFVTYISGCNQALIVPTATDNKYAEGQWLDEQRLEPVGKKIFTLNNDKNPGFDLQAPKR